MYNSYRSLLKTNSGKIVNNILWLLLDKGLRMGLGLVVGVWIARYLGPDQFGKLNYGQAFIAIFATIVNLGLDTTLVKELVKKPFDENKLIGTSFLLRLCCAVLAISLAVLTGYLLEYESDSLSFLIILVLSIGMVFQSADVIELYLQSQLQSKISVLVKNAAYILSSGFKVYLLVNHFPLLYFAIAVVVELALAALLLAMYADKRLPIKLKYWKWDSAIASNLVKTSWPLILSALTVILYMRIDQIMIKSMLDSYAVGNYSAAVRITEIIFFIPMIISNSAFPSLVNASSNLALFHKNLTRLYAVMIYSSVALSLCIMLLAPYIIGTLFGAQYQSASSVLTIHVWSSIFVFIGVASSQQLVIEGKTKVTLYRTSVGVLSNVLLNLILIPKFGIQGAAFATLISYAASSFLSNFLFRETRIINLLYLKALFLFKKTN